MQYNFSKHELFKAYREALQVLYPLMANTKIDEYYMRIKNIDFNEE